MSSNKNIKNKVDNFRNIIGNDNEKLILCIRQIYSRSFNIKCGEITPKQRDILCTPTRKLGFEDNIIRRFIFTEFKINNNDLFITEVKSTKEKYIFFYHDESLSWEKQETNFPFVLPKEWHNFVHNIGLSVDEGCILYNKSLDISLLETNNDLTHSS